MNAPHPSDALAEELVHHRFSATTEAELQRALAEYFVETGKTGLLPVEREHVLSQEERIDFYLPDWSLGIEVKIKGSPNAVYRQLARYAQHGHIERLWLITTRAALRMRAETIGTKPFRVLYLEGNSFG